MLIRITVANRGPEAATLHVLPTLWFRNTWSWGCKHEGCTLKPRIEQTGPSKITASHPTLGNSQLHVDASDAHFLFTENETNSKRLFGVDNASAYVKDAFHEFVIRRNAAAVNPTHTGTKAAAFFKLEIPAGEARCFG